jgi:hypothetical protein
MKMKKTVDVISYVDDFCYDCQVPFRKDLDRKHDNHSLTLGKALEKSNKKLELYNRLFNIGVGILVFCLLVQLVCFVLQMLGV